MFTLSVSGLNEQIKGLLETSFTQVFVEGELSRITFHNSGHIYFTLKDSSSVISCVMFRGNASKLKFRLEEGMKVVLNAALTLYKPRGSYQLNCFSIEPSGQGALALAYEQLKQKLSAQGYFSSEIKKQLPKFPSRIALITSATGAALQDMLRVANSRYKNIEIDIYDVLVQGDSASGAIVNAVQLADTRAYDILVLGRGGGSIEDLWAFNEERVADVIFHAKTPIISAVGHEIDWVISDFVADVRAATPSAAMEICLPDVNELYQYIDSLSTQIEQLFKQKIHTKSQELEHLRNSFVQHSVEKKLQAREDEIQQLKENFFGAISFNIKGYERELQSLKQQLPQAIDRQLHFAEEQLLGVEKTLQLNNPKYKTKTGFAQLSKNSKVIDIDSLEVDSEFNLQSDTVFIKAKVIHKEHI
ncbi:MAG: exodeoxyribonuclease VII large subunit [Sulfurimonas sp.]|nr:exodeoxyribonuclease VII large subunit [Sulfurimonas sp.]